MTPDVQVIPYSGDHQFVLARSALILRFQPMALPVSDACTLTLKSTEGPSYEQVLCPHLDADLVEGSADLTFLGVYRDGKYTLELDPGDGQKVITLFKDRSYASLVADFSVGSTSAAGAASTTSSTPST